MKGAEMMFNMSLELIEYVARTLVTTRNNPAPEP